MSRRVIIGILILLIVGIIGGTIALIFSRFRTVQDTAQTPQTSSLPQATTGGQQVLDPTGDADNDGLNNADEAIWGTNPAHPDTDGDGFLDGEEVATSHNPTISSPNDKLPAGFQPNQNINPLTPAAPATTSFESYFSDSVDVTGGSKNLTQEYGRAIPDKEKSPVSLSTFISTQPIVTTLPLLSDAAIKTQETSPANLAQYMRIAGNLEPISDRARLTIALNDFFESHDTYGFVTMTDSVASFQAVVKSIAVPTEAIQYHKILVGYTELLAGTLSQIARYDDDQVKAMVALRQLDAIDRQYYPILLQEQERLLSLSQ